MSEIAVFNFEEQEVRTITDEHGAPWFVARDVCDVLEIQNVSQALQGLDDDEKGISKAYTPGGTQQISII
ncbi:MAG: Bro-N domain-containing protein [Desulfobulbus sp.]|jgi:prophage antirepressor-like protein